MKAKIPLAILSLFFSLLDTTAQTDSTKLFNLSLEFRPRIEFRNGYRQLPTDTSNAAYFGTQRSRLQLTYSQPRFKFYTSIQDLRVWGQYGQVSTTGSLNVFEAYVESWFTNDLFLRIGRQKVEFDNGRLLSAANWNQGSRAHDGLNLVWKKEKFTSEFMTYFNQTSERIFETDFSPTSFNNYKLLTVHYLNAKLNKNTTLTTINAADGHQSKTNARTMYVRGTSGGRIEFTKNKFYATINAFYQYGQSQTGQPITAYYFQPELRFEFKKITSLIGAEYMSGDDATQPSSHLKSFVPLYGVAWKFMGNMDYFTTFPSDLKNGGLFNPYLFLFYDVHEKMLLRSDFHLFYLQNKVLHTDATVIPSYLGFEQDMSVKYKFNDFTTLDFGFSYLLAEESLEKIKGGNSKTIPVWSYLMVTFKPELFSYKKSANTSLNAR